MPQMLGTRIREARKAANLSQSQLATKIGAHFTSVSDWERGRNAPSARHLISIAEATGTELAHFVESGEDEEEEADIVAALMRLVDRRARRVSREELRRFLSEESGAMAPTLVVWACAFLLLATGWAL